MTTTTPAHKLKSERERETASQAKHCTTDLEQTYFVDKLRKVRDPPPQGDPLVLCITRDFFNVFYFIDNSRDEKHLSRIESQGLWRRSRSSARWPLSAAGLSVCYEPIHHSPRHLTANKHVIGKSSLTVQYVDGHFVDSYYPTIENTFSKVIRYRNQDFAVEIIDTAGQDEYTILNSKHFIGIHGYMIVYSVASKQSFEMCRIIRDKILNHLV